MCVREKREKVSEKVFGFEKKRDKIVRLRQSKKVCIVNKE